MYTIEQFRQDVAEYNGSVSFQTHDYSRLAREERVIKEVRQAGWIADEKWGIIDRMCATLGVTSRDAVAVIVRNVRADSIRDEAHLRELIDFATRLNIPLTPWPRFVAGIESRGASVVSDNWS